MIESLANRESFSGSARWQPREGNKWTKGFIYTAGAVLLITAAAKLVSAGGDARILQRPDPVFGISFRSLFFLVGTFEMAVAAFCFFGNRRGIQAALVAWLGTSFLLYRLGLWWVGYPAPCPCLGSLTGALHIPQGAADMVMKVLLVYLVAGSYASLLWLGLKARQEGAH